MCGVYGGVPSLSALVGEYVKRHTQNAPLKDRQSPQEIDDCDAHVYYGDLC